MGAALQIEGVDVVQLAEELAELRKVSIHDAVASALKLGLQHERETARRFELIGTIAAAIHADLDQPLTSSDHTWMYDENGLPI